MDSYGQSDDRISTILAKCHGPKKQGQERGYYKYGKQLTEVGLNVSSMPLFQIIYRNSVPTSRKHRESTGRINRLMLVRETEIQI
jgi:hypothetical protein